MEAIEANRAAARHRLTVDEYQRMGEAGVFAPDARVELIDGEVIDRAPIGSRHASAVRRLNAALVAAVAGRAIVSVQSPIRLDRLSEPEPDIALLVPDAGFYAAAHPTAADTLLIIEVADSSARYNREVKVPLYARHGVAEVWIVDLDARLVRFFRRPHNDAYSDITSTETPGPTAVSALPDVLIDLADLFG